MSTPVHPVATPMELRNKCPSYMAGHNRVIYKCPVYSLADFQVDCGRDFMLADLHVDVSGDRLLITGDRARSRLASATPSRSPGSEAERPGSTSRLIKQFTLPPRADVAAITSRRGDDGRLAILVPVRR